MKNLGMLLLLVAFIYSCETNNCHCPIDNTILVENDSILQNAMKNAYFKGQWQRFDEPILFKQNKEAYRFYYRALPSELFKLYRIEKNTNDYALYIKEFAVVDGDNATLKKNFSRKLTEAEWSAITKTIDNKCFWTMPIKTKEPDYLDPTTFIIEGFRPENNSCTQAKYHLVARIQLENATSFVSIMEAFEALEGKSTH
jgi:hypothetical protein